MSADPRSTRRSLPAAASTLVAPVLAGPVAPASVLGVHRFALYLSVRGTVLPVVTSDAVPLPTAVRLAERSGAVPGSSRDEGWWGVRPGDVVAVGDGRIRVPDVDVVVARTWRPARVRAAAAAPPPRRECGSGCRNDHFRTHGEGCPAAVALPAEPGMSGDWLATGIRSLCSALTPRGECGCGCQSDHFRTHGGPGAVDALVGRGAGLTPSGDDVLAGALLVTHAYGIHQPLADAVRARLGATTAVSAALLDAAADGYAARPVVTLVDAAVAGDAEAVARALPAVLAIGHTSGADTVAGIRAALFALSALAARRPPAALPARGECGSGCQSDHFRTHGEDHGGRAA